jgi:hypothetical protein
MSARRNRAKSVKDLIDDIHARSWSGWGAHVVAYLIYMFLQLTLFDSLSGFLGIASRLLALSLTGLLLIHMLILCIRDWRLAWRRKVSSGATVSENPRCIWLDVDGQWGEYPDCDGLLPEEQR